MIDLATRFTYHPPKEGDPEFYEGFRARVRDLADVLVTNTQASPEQSIALRKLEEAVMWGNAARARHGAPLPGD